MQESIKEIREYIDFSRKLFTSNKVFILTESNVLDIYKKLNNNEEIPQEELDAVLKRFYELSNY